MTYHVPAPLGAAGAIPMPSLYPNLQGPAFMDPRLNLTTLAPAAPKQKNSKSQDTEAKGPKPAEELQFLVVMKK